MRGTEVMAVTEARGSRGRLAQALAGAALLAATTTLTWSAFSSVTASTASDQSAGNPTATTSFGALRIAAVSGLERRESGAASGGHAGGDPAAVGHSADEESVPGEPDGRATPAGDVPPIEVHVWENQIQVDVVVDNRLDRPVLLSPGQLRLHLGGSGGVTVAPLTADRDAGALAAETTERMSLRFLVPDEPIPLELHFTDPGLERPVRLALPARARADAETKDGQP